MKHTYTFNLQCEASDKKLKYFLQNVGNERTKENVIDIKGVNILKDEKNNDHQLTSILDSDIKEINENIKLGKLYLIQYL